jgi:hypothetical protein
VNSFTRAAISIGAFVLICGCGSSGSSSPLKSTADHLGDIHSGTLSLRFALIPAGATRGVGVNLSGPFSLAAGGPLPVARIAYVQQAGAAVRRATFTSTGRQAFVTTGGRTLRLSASQVSGLHVGVGEVRSLDDIGLHVERWVRHPDVTPGPQIDGQSTDRITGTLDANAALTDVVRGSGGTAGLTTADARRLAQTISASSVEVVAGKADHLLRRLALSVRMSVPPGLRVKLGGRADLRLTLAMAITGVNRSVKVSAPAA